MNDLTAQPVDDRAEPTDEPAETESTATESTEAVSEATESTAASVESDSIDTESTVTESTVTESTVTESTDTESTDTESTDTESTDTESTDTESTDTESTDTESTDTESTDTETGDTGPSDTETGETGPAEPRYARFDCTDPDNRAAVSAAAGAARRAIESGECVVLPTDTVYGIGADAYDAEAVQRLLDAKGRGRDMPPPVLIADKRGLKALTAKVPEQAEALVDAYWPGALTIICDAAENLRMDLGETRGTVALRVPDHPLTRALLRQTGPLAVSSANRTGRPSALTCDDAIEQLGDRVAVYLDGGEVSGTAGKPSTMIDFTVKETGQILRRGALALDELREYLPELEDLTAEEEAEPAPVGHTVEELRARHTLQPPLES